MSQVNTFLNNVVSSTLWWFTTTTNFTHLTLDPLNWVYLLLHSPHVLRTIADREDMSAALRFRTAFPLSSRSLSSYFIPRYTSSNITQSAITPATRKFVANARSSASAAGIKIAASSSTMDASTEVVSNPLLTVSCDWWRYCYLSFGDLCPRDHHRMQLIIPNSSLNQSYYYS